MYCNLILRISEAKIRVNVWTVHRDKTSVCCRLGVRCGDVAVSGGLTV